MKPDGPSFCGVCRHPFPGHEPNCPVASGAPVKGKITYDRVDLPIDPGQTIPDPGYTVTTKFGSPSISQTSPIPSGLETDPEASAKRTAEMQQMTKRSGPYPDNLEPVGELTVIWATEKAEILRRLKALENYEHEAKRDVLSRLDMVEAKLSTLIE